VVCWLKFLKFVNDALKDTESNLSRRKALAIEILKDMENEEGHDIAKIEKKIKEEGKRGLFLRAKKKKKQKEDEEENEEEIETEKEESEDKEGECVVPEEKW
jgi:hypothetical protein